MKKNYIKPEMKVYEIETPQLLAASSDPALHNDGPVDGNDDIL